MLEEENLCYCDERSFKTSLLFTKSFPKQTPKKGNKIKIFTLCVCTPFGRRLVFLSSWCSFPWWEVRWLNIKSKLGERVVGCQIDKDPYNDLIQKFLVSSTSKDRSWFFFPLKPFTNLSLFFFFVLDLRVLITGPKLKHKGREGMCGHSSP